MVSAVSVTQVLRAAFATGLPLSSFRAAASSLVPFGSVGAFAARNRPISAYVRPPDASSAWMRMYWAKQRASLPFSIGCSATSHEGAATFWRPASFMATVIAAGLMSAEPTIFSRVSSSPTVFRALMLMTSAPTPNTIMMTPAMMPPISSALRPVICSYLPVDFPAPTPAGVDNRSVSLVVATGIRATAALAPGNSATVRVENY